MLTKYASFEQAEVLDVKSSPTKVKTASLNRLSDFHDYRTDDGYLYVRIRAISSRVNKNHDGWPTAELAGGSEAWEKISSQRTAGEGFTIEASSDSKYGFSTFLAKPHFVDHHNSDPKRTRGAVVDAKFRVLDEKTASEDPYWGTKRTSADDNSAVDPEHFPASEVELLIEVDAESFPHYAEAIANGDIDGFSMGCDVEYSKCSHCGNKASTPDEYCSHIVAKGAEHDFTSSTGERISKKSYENCYGIGFFEISGVFDPADETATAKEVVASVYREAGQMRCPYCSGTGCEKCGMQGAIEVPNNDDGTYMLNGDQATVGNPILPGEPGLEGPNVREQQGAIMAPHLTLPVEELRRRFPNLGPPHQGSYLQTRTAMLKQAEPDEPQEFKTKAPEDVDTLRQEKICPLCGSDMDEGQKCQTCGYEEPPEQLQNPDLTKAQGLDDNKELNLDQTQPSDPTVAPDEANQNAESYLMTRNPQPTASVNSEMRWRPKGIDLSKLAAPRPQGDEPNETVTSDQTTPVTSAFRTAKQMIADAAKRNQEKNMADSTKVAADPADPSGKAKKRVDVEGVGGVDEANAEAASKADTRVDVEGKGGIIQDSNAEASKPDEKESIEQTSDNAGFQEGGKTGPHTQTFPNSNEPGSAVTDKAYPTAAKKGTDPADPVGKAGDRIDVEKPPHDRVGPDTDQWTGTGGNGVTRQQDPVTNKPTQSGGITSGLISLAALRLADTEVELGLLERDKKYDRLAELAAKDDVEIEAEHRALAKVKTAGLTRTASKGGVGRLPSFQRIASQDPVPEATEQVDQAQFDAGLYS